MERLIAVLGAVLLVGCLAAPGPMAWESVATLPADFSVTDTVPVAGGAVLLVGYQVSSASAGLTARRAYIARYDGALSAPFEGQTGWIQAADASGTDAWAVHARLEPDGEGSTYELLTSGDGGATWTSGGPIPTTSLTAVAVEGGGCGWAMGVGALLRSCDSGRSWTAIEAPGCCRAIAQPLVATGPGEALLGGAALLRTTDGGTTWIQLTDQEVVATDGRYVAGRAGGRIRLGRIGGAGVQWTGSLDGELLPDRLVSDGLRVLLRAAPLGKRAGDGVLLLRSEDGGATVTEALLRGGGPTAQAGLVDPSSAWRVDGSRRLRRGSWR
jgi:hypothetical protein